ncbi:uncharacterized protein LOC129199826 [Grus americana]|uniref:uncharacterized protein LOC129199826 n=1 Tax=Grus americana TaxID=9117 RepID=UPI002407A3F9|nr:uncharacterized protein LOC129199826 [Grus americana]
MRMMNGLSHKGTLKETGLFSLEKAHGDVILALPGDYLEEEKEDDDDDEKNTNVEQRLESRFGPHYFTTLTQSQSEEPPLDVSDSADRLQRNTAQETSQEDFKVNVMLAVSCTTLVCSLTFFICCCVAFVKYRMAESSLGIWLLASAGDRALGQMDPRNELTPTFVLSSELRAMQLVPDEADLVITAQRAQEVSQQAAAVGGRMMRPSSCFGASPCPLDGSAGGGCQRPRCQYRHEASRHGEPPSAGPRPAPYHSQGLSLSSVMNENENAKQQCQPIEVSPCENQDGNSKMSPFRSRNVFTKRPRNSSPVKLEIKLQESDDECDLIIDVPPLVVNKKPRISRKCTNGKRDKELASVMHAELHDSAIVDILGRAGEESERMMILQKSGKGLNNYEKLDMVSPKANEMYLPDVNTDILKVLVERDALAYTEDKRVSSAAFFEADIQKGILQQGNAETNVLVKPFVQERTTNEDCLSSGRVTQSVLCTGRSSKDETIIERPYEEIIVNTEKRQSIQENGGNDSPKDTYPYPASYLNKKGSEKTLLSSSVEEVEPSEEETELSESDDPLEECRRIFDEFEREIQKKNSDKQAHRGNADLNLLETKVNLTGQKRRIAHRAKFDGHDAGIQQAMEFGAAVKRGQDFIATTPEQKKITSGLSATQFQSIGPMASLNLVEVHPIKISSGQLHILLGGNVATAMPCGLSVSSFKRTALVPCKVSTQRRPSIPESGSKVPFETRQRYIGLFLAECFKMCGTVNEAIDKALIEEQSVYDRCGSKKMYLNFAVKTLKKLRDHGQLSNSRSSSGTGSIKSEEEKAFKRMCCRCGEVYAITSSGEHRRKEECNYHSGRVLEQKGRYP